MLSLKAAASGWKLKKALLDVREQVIALSTEIASRVLQAKLTSEEDQALVARKTDEALQSR